jgi:hypothetical protein
MQISFRVSHREEARVRSEHQCDSKRHVTRQIACMLRDAGVTQITVRALKDQDSEQGFRVGPSLCDSNLTRATAACMQFRCRAYTSVSEVSNKAAGTHPDQLHLHPTKVLQSHATAIHPSVGCTPNHDMIGPPVGPSHRNKICSFLSGYSGEKDVVWVPRSS